jgi:hypothetical protein
MRLNRNSFTPSKAAFILGIFFNVGYIEPALRIYLPESYDT